MIRTPKDNSHTNEEEPWGLDTRVGVMMASLTIGVLTGLAAIGFLSIVSWAVRLWDLQIPVDLSWSNLFQGYSITVIVCLLLAALVAGQILTTLENGRPHGPADLILAAQRNEDPNLKAGFKSTALALTSLVGGGSVGMFGPLVHFGGCLSAGLRRWGSRLSPHLPKDIVLGSGRRGHFSGFPITDRRCGVCPRGHRASIWCVRRGAHHSGGLCRLLDSQALDWP